MRIVQITDTHLSPIKPHFNRNWEPLVAWIDQQRPDLIIHTGDLSVDGADVEADLLFCQACLNDLPRVFSAFRAITISGTFPKATSRSIRSA